MTAAELAAALAEGIKAGLLGEGFAYEPAADWSRYPTPGPYALVPTPEVHRLMAEHFPAGGAR